MRYFNIREFRCKHCNKVHMDEGFLYTLDYIRHLYKAPIYISSGYRCPEYNARISSTGRTGPHTTGKAVDIPCSGEDAFKLLYIAMLNGITGIGVKQKGSGRFLHFDTIKHDTLRPRIWSY